MTPREDDFHRVGHEKYSHFQFDFWSVWLHETLISTVLDLKFFWIFNLIFGVFDSTRGWFLPCWTWKIFRFSIWFLESMTPREDDFHCVGLENFSDFQFYFWSVWLNERLFSNVLDLKIFRIFNLILGVYDATAGWFPLYCTWKFFLFSIWFLESLTPRARGWFSPWWTWNFFGFSIWFLESMTPREADFHRVGLENISDF